MYELDVDDDSLLAQELAALRQVIMRVEPAVMLDGRFEEMFTSPVTVLRIARRLLEARQSVNGRAERQ